MDETSQLNLFENEGVEATLASPEPEAIRKIRDKFEGIVISVSQGPQSKQLTAAQKAAAVKDSGASTDAITMGKRLFDKRVVSRVKELRDVKEIFAEINQLKIDKTFTLPHPDPGVRLVRKGDSELDRMSDFVKKIQGLEARLSQATLALKANWHEVKKVAEQELGKYYDEADYAFDPHATMKVSYKFMEVGVPTYLRHNAKLYEREEARVRAEMEMVKNMKEAEMAEAMFETIDRIVERLENRKLLDDSHEVLEISNPTAEQIQQFLLDEQNRLERCKEAEKEGKKIPHRDQQSLVFGLSVIKDVAEFMREDPVLVFYQPSDSRAKKDRRFFVMTKDESRHRIKGDRKPKTFRDASVAQLFEGLDHAKEMLDELSLGDGQIAKSFDKLRGVIRGQDASSLAGALRNSDSYRDSIRERLTKISEHMIDSIIEKPRRSVMRRRQRQNRKLD